MSVLLMLAGFMVGFYIIRGVRKTAPIVDGGSKFDEVMWYIGNDYVEQPDAHQLQDEAIAAMMEKLDPHSAYVSLEEFNEVNDPLLGSFDGIGVQFRLEKDTIAIVNVIKGGPSEKVGILAGDRIIYVDDTLVASKNLKNEDVMRKLKGPKNTKVRVKVLRRGVEGLLDYTITRAAIPTYSVDIAYMLDEKIGYLKLSKFCRLCLAKCNKNRFFTRIQKLQQILPWLIFAFCLIRVIPIASHTDMISPRRIRPHQHMACRVKCQELPTSHFLISTLYTPLRKTILSSPLIHSNHGHQVHTLHKICTGLIFRN